MSTDSDIQWCDDTVNPTMGCDGCELWTSKLRSCYAGKLHDIRGGRKGHAESFEKLAFFPGRSAIAARKPPLDGTKRMKKPWLDGHPRTIFVSDMSDALSRDVSFEFLEAEILAPVVSERGAGHRWLWLTKQPKRMAEFSRWAEASGWTWPENLWVGTSITTQATARARIPHLLDVGDNKTTRFLSVEPQWEEVELSAWLRKLDWVIQGGESGTDAKPFELEWARGMRGACRQARVAYFLKQLGRRPHDGGKPLSLRDKHGGDWSEWDSEFCVREFPGFV